jgi:hypothetical protein
MTPVGEIMLRIETTAKRIYCWLFGHGRLCFGEKYNYEPDWCERCGKEDPQDDATLPDHLCGWYGWFVERDWRWFNILDTWAMEHNVWPRWLEY